LYMSAEDAQAKYAKIIGTAD